MHPHPKPPVEIFVEKVAEQWKLLAVLLGAVLIGVAGYGLASSLKAKKELAATNALYEAQSAAHKAVTEKKFDDAEKAFTAMVQAHRGTRAAFEAQLQAGDTWMDAGNFDKAVSFYQAAAGAAGDAFSRLLASYSVGVAKESAGKFDEAVKAYDEALGISGSDFLRPELLMAQARCYEALHQAPKAIEIYKTVQDKFASRAYYSGAASAFEKQLSAGAKL